MFEPNYETEPIRFPLACPGCSEDYDPRTHMEAWCQACRPAGAGAATSLAGSMDNSVSLDQVRGYGDVDPENQRAAAALWGRGAEA